jgi:hypothetical protein
MALPPPIPFRSCPMLMLRFKPFSEPSLPSGACKILLRDQTAQMEKEESMARQFSFVLRVSFAN